MVGGSLRLFRLPPQLKTGLHLNIVESGVKTPKILSNVDAACLGEATLSLM